MHRSFSVSCALRKAAGTTLPTILGGVITMSTRVELVNWFDELGLARKDLPYEITKVFADNEEYELKKSINLSVDHVERVLAFQDFLKYGPEEPDEFWHDLQATLDTHSYYACLALPFVRQLLEPSVNFIYTDIEDRNRIDWDKFGQPAFPESVMGLPKHQQQVARDAWTQACRMQEINRKYLSLSSAKEFADWSKYFLESCANLILIAARLSQIRSR